MVHYSHKVNNTKQIHEIKNILGGKNYEMDLFSMRIHL